MAFFIVGACTQVHGIGPPSSGRGSVGADAWDMSGCLDLAASQARDPGQTRREKFFFLGRVLGRVLDWVVGLGWVMGLLSGGWAGWLGVTLVGWLVGCLLGWVGC